MTDYADALTTLTAQIVAAYVSGQAVTAAGVPVLIRQVHATLGNLAAGDDGAPMIARPPAVPIKESVFPDRVICLECGFSATMLRRHLSTAHGLEPDQYRAKWGLPSNYPIVAPDYAEVRSSLAKQSGLGVRRKKARR